MTLGTVCKTDTMAPTPLLGRLDELPHAEQGQAWSATATCPPQSHSAGFRPPLGLCLSPQPPSDLPPPQALLPPPHRAFLCSQGHLSPQHHLPVRSVLITRQTTSGRQDRQLCLCCVSRPGVQQVLGVCRGMKERMDTLGHKAQGVCNPRASPGLQSHF